MIQKFVLFLLLFSILRLSSQYDERVENFKKYGNQVASLKDLKSRRFYVEKRIEFKPHEAICFRSVGLVEDQATGKLTQEEFNAINDWAQDIHKQRASGTFKEKCAHPNIKYYMDHKLPSNLDDGFDHVDMKAMVFQMNYNINYPESCKDRRFAHFAERLPIVNTKEHLLPNNEELESFQCFPIIKTNKFVLSEEYEENLMLFLGSRVALFEGTLPKKENSDEEEEEDEEYGDGLKVVRIEQGRREL